MYKGRNYYSKLVLKQCYFWLAHHTCLLSGTSTTAHPKPPTSVEKKTRQRNIPLRTMELRRKGEKSLGSYTGAAPRRAARTAGLPESSSCSAWTAGQRGLGSARSATGMWSIKACGGKAALPREWAGRGGVSQAAPPECWGKSLVLKDPRWYC